MSPEELKKNYILLSRVAKEKKYAQEYLGLLARRGDIGSIRIGKRWYTTAEWFSEFLADAEIRKTESRIAEVKIDLAKSKISEKEKAKVVFIQKGKKLIQENEAVKSLRAEEKKTPLKFSMKPSFHERKSETINLRKVNVGRFSIRREKPAEKVNGVDKRIEKYAWQNVPKRKKEAQDSKIISQNISPNFAYPESGIPLLQKFAFSLAVVLVLVLLAQISFFFKDEIRKLAKLDSGMVAGARDSEVDLSAVKNFSLGYLENHEDKIKEDVSLSRVLIKAAMEKNSEGNTGN
jgi:hypothetical protein